MYLARAVHFDESDSRIFHRPAVTGEWAISGGFEFSNWTDADLSGKARQAFANGWLGLDSFGRVTFVAVTRITPGECAALTHRLAGHFVSHYGAPSIDVALPVAGEEMRHMTDLCADHDPNTVLTVARSLTSAGVREEYRWIRPQETRLQAFAVHASPDGGGQS
ncbi:MAG: hypothetical protein H6851_00600 [Geminicoccaceae bacterium]|nr:hypothetical protein [Geminicoccaceae bacterium]MCB9942107.1 hypothetical protein [Geminicoccaceae bacterium]